LERPLIYRFLYMAEFQKLPPVCSWQFTTEYSLEFWKGPGPTESLATY